jgi:hypothetical protein
MRATLFYDPADPTNQYLASLRSYDLDVEEERKAHGVDAGWRYLTVANQDGIDGLLNGGTAVIQHGEIVAITPKEETAAELNSRRKDRAVALFLEAKRLESIVNEFGQVFDMSDEESRKAAIEAELVDILDGKIQPSAPRIAVDGRLMTAPNANN